MIKSYENRFIEVKTEWDFVPSNVGFHFQKKGFDLYILTSSNDFQRSMLDRVTFFSKNWIDKGYEIVECNNDSWGEYILINRQEIISCSRWIKDRLMISIEFSQPLSKDMYNSIFDGEIKIRIIS